MKKYENKINGALHFHDLVVCIDYHLNKMYSDTFQMKMSVSEFHLTEAVLIY